MVASRMPWLRPAPDDFRARCDAVDGIAAARGDALRQLAAHELSETQLVRLARSLRAARAAAFDAPLAPLVLGVVSNATTDFIAPAIEGTGVRHGFSMAVTTVPFGVTLQAALASDSSIVRANPDAILLALDYRSFFPEFNLDDKDAEGAVSGAIAHLRELIAAFQSATRAAILVQTVAAPPERLFGSFDRRQSGTPSWLAARFNDRVARDVVGPGVTVFDVEALATQVGLAFWYDVNQYLTARLPFAAEHVPLYSEHLMRLITAIRGRSRKVLALDLDNTLWGGVIGDDGIDGIRLGQGDPRGEAFLEFQRAARALKQRGILLVVCSKNDESVALKAIREHPEMLLRENDFSAFQINWADKATNLEILANRLSLGLDAFVFLDDNPAERSQVRQALPQVLVPELPSDPAAYARVLMTAGLFEAVTFSEEDRGRVEQYAANGRRESLRAQSRNLDSFLRSLAMQATFTTRGDVGWSRFAQLINKSNQFNLTTRRYTESELQILVADASTLTLQVRLVDQFGDNGMICAVIAVPQSHDWLLDTWVMSCRVVDRLVEQAVLNRIVAEARARGIRRLIGIYRPTERNGMVKDHYAKLGFARAEACVPGEDRWQLDVSAFTAFDVPIATQRDLMAA
jgi:FkbH-like protein